MKRLKIDIVVFILAFFLGGNLLGQANNKQDLQPHNRWYFGGQVSFNHGRSFTMAELAPALGYFISKNVLVGIQAYYIFYSTEGEFEKYNFNSESNYVGTGLFSRYYFRSKKKKLPNNFFAHAEYEYLLGEERYTENNEPAEIIEFDNHSVLTGLGYQHDFNEKVGVSMTVLWNIQLSDSNSSPYQNPIVRIGFEF